MDGVLIAGAAFRLGAELPSAQLYRPQYLSLANRPAIAGLPSSIWSAGSTVSLNVGAAHGLGSVALMGLPAITHGIDTSARRLVLPITSPWNPTTGAVAVQVRSVAQAPAGHYYAIALARRASGPHRPAGRRRLGDRLDCGHGGSPARARGGSPSRGRRNRTDVTVKARLDARRLRTSSSEQDCVHRRRAQHGQLSERP